MNKQIFLIKMLPLQVALLFNSVFASNGGPYEIDIQGISCGGGQMESPSYSTTSSIGGIGGLSGHVIPEIIARAGFPGQLFDIDRVEVTADPSSINEGGNSQLHAAVVLDDGTFILSPNAGISWSTESGPANTNPLTGEVTPAEVYFDSVATMGATFRHILGTTTLTIINSDPDNYPGYDGDGVDDDWQVFYFGAPPNPDADPSSNPDRDPDDNWMEFLTGFDPTDPSQWFQLTIINKTGSEATLQLNKVIPNRTYTIQAGTDLLSFPDTVDTLNPSIQEFDITVTDTNATEQKLFYRVEITRP